MKRITYCCEICGGENIALDAAVRWDKKKQVWDITTIFDSGDHCDDCEKETRAIEKEIK